MQKNFMSMIHNRLHNRNQNAIIIFVGPTGSGKSFGAMRFCELQDPTFNIDRVVFNNQEFEELINGRKIPPTSWICWDEAGVGISARRAMSTTNVRSTAIMQIFRSELYGLALTVPSLAMVDSQIRALAHYVAKPTYIDRYKKRSHFKLRNIEHNETLGKTYIKPVKIGYDRKRTQVGKLCFRMPSKKLRQAYDKKKQTFQQRIYANPNKTDKASKTAPDMSSIIEDIKKEGVEKYLTKQKKINYVRVQNTYGIGRGYAMQVKTALEDELNGIKTKAFKSG